MKIIKNNKARYAGFTLLELTLSVSILLGLIGITVTASQVYVRSSQEAGCLLVQDKIRKLLESKSNLDNIKLEPGVDYCAEPEFKALFDEEMQCPEGGGYSAELDAESGVLIIKCLEHGHSHK